MLEDGHAVLTVVVAVADQESACRSRALLPSAKKGDENSVTRCDSAEKRLLCSSGGAVQRRKREITPKPRRTEPDEAAEGAVAAAPDVVSFEDAVAAVPSRVAAEYNLIAGVFEDCEGVQSHGARYEFGGRRGRGAG